MHSQFNNSDSFMNYAELASAFEGRPEEFIRVLKEVYEDFLNSHILIVDAINENNSKQFNRIYNDLRANINLFDMHRLRELMNKIEWALEEGTKKDSRMINDLHQHFNLISQSLENKIKELNT
jgi:replication initiation and membrane attachment protein DnaB